MLANGWSKEEKINWSKRQAELLKLLKNNKSSNGGYDCIVPVSGGKMAHMLLIN